MQNLNEEPRLVLSSTSIGPQLSDFWLLPHSGLALPLVLKLFNILFVANDRASIPHLVAALTSEPMLKDMKWAKMVRPNKSIPSPLL